MSIPVIAFFNNKGGVGKTSLVYHIAWMYAHLGKRVVAADLDPQSNLTAAFLDEARIEQLWSDEKRPNTIFGAIRPLISGTGDISNPHLEIVGEGQPDLLTPNLALLVGDLSLSNFEDELSQQWSDCLDRKERAFRVISAFWRIMQSAGNQHEADVILMDLGPNLGAINRSALIAADYVVIPLSPDLFSIQGLRNLGPTLKRWRGEWRERLDKNPVPELQLPGGTMTPIGYVVIQPPVRLDRPFKAYEHWINQIPQIYHTKVLSPGKAYDLLDPNADSERLAILKHYYSLVPMAQEARKPVFSLKAADGAIGAHIRNVQNAYRDFEALTRKITERIGRVL